MTQTPTALDVARKAVDLAKANPDFIYEQQADSGGCLYVHRDADGKPIPGEGCLFGQAMKAAGVPVERSDEYNHIAAVLQSKGLDGPGNLLGVMEQAQARQDVGDPWGAVIEPLADYLADIDALAAVTA